MSAEAPPTVGADEPVGRAAPEHVIRSTAPEQPGPGWTRFERLMRALVYLVVVGVVVAALLGLAGLRTRDVSAASDRFEVRVTYAQITRPGISTPFEIDVVPTEGAELPARLEVRVSSDYLAMFDENGLDPEPESSASDGTEETWRFEIDPGTPALHVDFDARLQPNIHSGETGTVRVSEPGSDPVEVQFRTWVLP